MMTDAEVEDRTELPTPRRLREARKKGQVVVSRDLAAALSLLAVAGGLHVFGPMLIGGLRAGLSRSLSAIHEMGAGDAMPAVIGTGWSFFGAAAPLMIFVMAAAMAATLAQVGFLFTGETLRIRPERLDPFEGIRRAFSMPTFVGITGGLAKGAVILGVLAASLWQDRATLAGLSMRDLPEALGIVSGTAISLLGKTALALLALGLVDWAYRRWQHLRDLRMSRREIEDELKEFEGDPAIRERRRAHHQQLDESRLIARVSAAAVVVTDSGDLAVAIGAGPVVLAKGEGRVADRIRESALSHGIPVIERPDLAKALHRRGTAAGEIPAGLREGADEAIALAREMRGS